MFVRSKRKMSLPSFPSTSTGCVHGKQKKQNVSSLDRKLLLKKLNLAKLSEENRRKLSADDVIIFAKSLKGKIYLLV